MDAIELDQVLLLAAIVASIVLLLSMLVIAVRTRRIEDRLLDLDFFQDSIQRVEKELGEIGRFRDRMSDDLAQLRHHGEKRDEDINKMAKGFTGLQEWKSRVGAVSYEARHLFELEPVRELMHNLGSRPSALTADPSDKSNAP